MLGHRARLAGASWCRPSALSRPTALEGPLQLSGHRKTVIQAIGDSEGAMAEIGHASAAAASAASRGASLVRASVAHAPEHLAPVLADIAARKGAYATVYVHVAGAAACRPSRLASFGAGEARRCSMPASRRCGASHCSCPAAVFRSAPAFGRVRARVTKTRLLTAQAPASAPQQRC